MSRTFTHCNSHHGFLHLLLIIIILIQTPPPATAQLPNTLSPPPPDRISKLKFDKSMAIVLAILVVVFFILGFISVYTRRCADRGMRRRLDLAIPIIGNHHRRHRGLDQDIIETFPTFVYSTVKSLKIGMATLECAVCLNEFQDDETLRLIPKCSHVFHPECIDAWLANHSTCPVCRANLVPRPGDSPFFAIQIPDTSRPDPNNNQTQPDINLDNNCNQAVDVSPKVNNNNSVTVTTPNRPPRSRSTGFKIANWFRSHSTGHSLVPPGEDYERFTLRLPEEIRNQLVNFTPKSGGGGASFMRENSGRRGYRTRSVGSNVARRSYERFARPEQRGLSCTPPFMSRNKSVKGSTIDDVGERSSDRLFAGTNVLG